MTALKTTFNHHTLKSIAAEWLHDAVAEAERFHSTEEPLTESSWSDLMETYDDLKSDAQQALALRDYGKQVRLADTLTPEDPLTNDQKLQLQRELAKAQVELLEAHKRILSGMDGIEASHGHSASPEPTESVEKRSPSISFNEAVELYVKVKVEEDKDWSPRSAVIKIAKLHLFAWAQGNLPMTDISRTTIKSYVSQLKQLPSNLNKKYLGKSCNEVLAIEGLEPRSSSTANQDLQTLQGFFRWAVNEEHIDKDPSEGFKIKVRKREKDKRKPYKSEDLKNLFEPNRYLYETRGAAWKYWGPLIGLFTGSRCGEIAQLHVSDIVQEEGIWLFNITDDPSESDSPSSQIQARGLKNESSKRRIAIHEVLIELGLLDYVEAIKAGGHQQLFPNYTPSPTGAWSDKMSDWFNRTMLKNTGLSGKQLTFHGFRHTLNTQLAGLDDTKDSHIRLMLGHSDDGMTYGQYFHGLPPQQLKRVMDRLSYGLDFTRLKKDWPKPTKDSV